MTPQQGPGTCKACLQHSRELTSGYCIPCWDTLVEARDEWDARQRELDRMSELDRESAESYAEYDFKEDDDD